MSSDAFNRGSGQLQLLNPPPAPSPRGEAGDRGVSPSLPSSPVAPPPARSASPVVPTFPVRVRTLRDDTADALSRLPSAPSSAALPRDPVLGLTQPTEPLTAPARALLARVIAAGHAGYRLREHDVLAAFDLYRRGELEPIDDWTYRVKRAA